MNEKLPRRNFLSRLTSLFGASVALPLIGVAKTIDTTFDDYTTNMNPIKHIKPLGFQWETSDPFLFCVHHEDFFPKGNGNFGPDSSYFKGRSLGDDFIIKDGFRMYHGKSVPGFPGHPHRGFETITVVRKGVVDHADSLGAAGRYGNGDVQWMTAGKGVQHSEMFPLIHEDKENTMELFQIWLNLPRKSKMVEPHFKMLWRENIPLHTHRDDANKETQVEVIAGKLLDKSAPAPPPDSWAADEHNEVAVWNIKMSPGATWVLPKAGKGINRTIYIYEGVGMMVNNQSIEKYHAVELDTEITTILKNGNESASILLLQGRPINEPVIQYGPFVMNSKEEINKSFEDYHKTQFGGWPWSRYDQVHSKDKSRFALHADGKLESKEW
jgi:quercetin 2,3-dioxygenase